MELHQDPAGATHGSSARLLPQDFRKYQVSRPMGLTLDKRKGTLPGDADDRLLAPNPNSFIC